MAFLTDRTLTTGVTLQDLIHIVNPVDLSQGNPAGSSYKATIQQVSNTILSGVTDVFVTGYTYNNNVFTIKQNNGQPDLTTIINVVTGWTINGNLLVTGNTSLQSTTASTLTISSTPVTDPTNNNVLVRDTSTGLVKTRNISTTLHNYGSFYSVLDQTPAVVGTTYTISAETQSFASGISVTNGGRYTLTNGGVYNIQFSLQILKTAGTKPLLYIWLYKNGSNVPYSNTEFTMDGSNNDRHVASWNFLESFNSGEYFEIRWATNITDVTLDYVASPTYGPAIPSVIITISQVA